MLKYRNHRLFRQALSIGGWQALAKAVAFFASTWAARCLGPEKLGISSMVAAGMGVLWILNTPHVDILLTRRFKLLESSQMRSQLISTVFTWRFTVILILGGLTLPVALATLGPGWRLAVLASLPLLLFVANPPQWLLMGQEKMPAQSQSGAIQSIVTGLSYLAFFHPNQAVGSDVVVLAVATGIGWIYGWSVAIGRVWPLPFNFKKAKGMLPLLSEGRWLIAVMACYYICQAVEMPLLGLLGSIPSLGQYRTAQSLTAVVAQFLAFAPTLLYPRFIEWHKLGANVLWNRQVKLTKAAGTLTCVVVAAAGLLSPMAYRLLYGPSFEAAAHPFVILLAARFVALINGIFTWGLWAQGEDRKLALLMLPIAALSLLLNILLIPKYGMMAAASTNLTSETLLLAGAGWICWRNKEKLSSQDPTSIQA
jgi:O-antigen/teichoic acid export membrane protein